MIIISIQGRLGNQMFEYALYECLRYQGKEVYVDLACNRQHDEDKGIMTDVQYNLGIFQPQYEIADPRIVQEWLMDGVNRNFMKRWEYRFFINHCKYYQEKKPGCYDANVFRLEQVYLCGYWQSEKYFCNIAPQIRKIYQFPNSFSKYQKELLDKIKKTNSVSLHIRRGDYLQHPEIYGNTNLNYYAEAMQYLERRKENLHFFLFTDDILWAKKHFQSRNITIVERTENLIESNLDMALMSQCNYNIIANSSYSWWGAWLNQNPNKIVIAPKIWAKNSKMTDIWCDGWIKI